MRGGRGRFWQSACDVFLNNMHWDWLIYNTGGVRVLKKQIKQFLLGWTREVAGHFLCYKAWDDKCCMGRDRQQQLSGWMDWLV